MRVFVKCVHQNGRKTDLADAESVTVFSNSCNKVHVQSVMEDTDP